MKKNLLLLGICFFAFINEGLTQATWVWEELNPMPARIANNAVSQVTVGGETYVCTFGGIDSTKTLEGISGLSMRMAVSTGEWEVIPDLPDSLGKIASGANTVGDIIYIIGGYHVFDSAPFELSSDRVHRYDAGTNTYLSDGAPVPVPIDDQVQAVWRDSLIYVVTGWSQVQNVANVQIYDPALDQWSGGTPVPNSSVYKAFGASGVIIGDTIFYNGGAAGSSFNSTGRLRKGVINPEDPTDITWSELGNNPGPFGYRMAAVAVEERAYWIGGSGVTYNYDGIAYNGSGGVEPLTRILSYDPGLPSSPWYSDDDQPFGVMDLRGIAEVGANEFVICGGMSPDQEVSNKAYKLTYSAPSGLDDYKLNAIQLVSNLIQAGESLRLQAPFHKDMAYQIYDLKGSLLAQNILNAGDTEIHSSSMEIQSSGSYILVLGEGVAARFTIH